MIKSIKAMTVGFAVVASACATESRVARDVRETISDGLPVGSTTSEIEAFLSQHAHRFGWDSYLGKWGAIVDVGKFHSVLIWLYVDDEGRLVSAEVADAYNSL